MNILPSKPNQSRWTLSHFATVASLSVLLGLSSQAQATKDQSYQSLRNWITDAPGPNEQLAPNQHLGVKDRALLEKYIPHTA